MNKFLLAGVLACLMILNVQAQTAFDDNFADNKPLREYFAADANNENKSIIYLFYNGEQCFDCPQTIEMVENLYNEEYAELYSLFVIDYTQDNGFDYAQTYDLFAPLALVLVKIQNGEMLGYRKLNDLNIQSGDNEFYTRYLSEEINNFLGDSDI